mgnify:FL=1
MDVVRMEDSASITFSSIKGVVQISGEEAIDDSRQVLTYDDLVEKIFEADRIIVL